MFFAIPFPMIDPVLMEDGPIAIRWYGLMYVIAFALFRIGGLALAATEDNLAVMARQSREAGARVLLLGMQVPPNYGRAYTDAFAALFRSVADREKAALLPFFLDGVAERPELFQPDRIHPNEAAQSRLLDNVWPALRPLLG